MTRTIQPAIMEPCQLVPLGRLLATTFTARIAGSSEGGSSFRGLCGFGGVFSRLRTVSLNRRSASSSRPRSCGVSPALFGA